MEGQPDEAARADDVKPVGEGEEYAELREEDVTRDDALNDDVREGEGESA